MKSILTTIGLGILILFNSFQGIAQPLDPWNYYSSFEYKKGKNAVIHIEKVQDSTLDHVFLFHFKAYFDMVFLGDSLNLKKLVKSETLPSEIWEKPIQGAIDKGNTMYVFMGAGSYMNIYETLLFKVNKEDGSFKSLPLGLNPVYLKEMESNRAKLIRTFSHNNRFYKIWHSYPKNKLYVFYYELGEVNQMYFHSMDIPRKELDQQTDLKTMPAENVAWYRGTYYDYHPSLFNQYPDKHNIYLFEDKMLVTVVNRRYQRTELIAVNIQNWEIEPWKYAKPTKPKNSLANNPSTGMGEKDEEWSNTRKEVYRYSQRKNFSSVTLLRRNGEIYWGYWKKNRYNFYKK